MSNNKDEAISGGIAIYENKDGNVELRVDMGNETLWAKQTQIANLFSVDVRTINEHLKNIFDEGELDETSTIRKSRIVQNEGGRNVEREVNLYNLDAIIAVGYRVSSKKATRFRIWATGVLRDYVTRGYNLNHYKLDRSTESLVGLYDAVAFLQSNAANGIKGKITLTLSQKMKPKEK